MIVGETSGRITVTYWRTHIGHTPSIIDLRYVLQCKANRCPKVPVVIL